MNNTLLAYFEDRLANAQKEKDCALRAVRNAKTRQEQNIAVAYLCSVVSKLNIIAVAIVSLRQGE